MRRTCVYIIPLPPSPPHFPPLVPPLGSAVTERPFRQSPGRPSSSEGAHCVVLASLTPLAATLLPGEGASSLDPCRELSPLMGGFTELESGCSIQCSHPKAGGGSSPCWTKIGSSESPPGPLGSLLRGGVWPPGHPRINTLFLSDPYLCPGPGCVAFIHGLLCPTASRWAWLISGDPEGRWRPLASSFRVAVCRQRPLATAPVLSPPLPHPQFRASVTAPFPCPFRPRGRIA